MWKYGYTTRYITPDWEQKPVLKWGDYHYADYEDEDEEILSAVVMDNGSCTTQIGFGNEPLPRFTFPTITGCDQVTCYYGVRVGPVLKDNYSGHEVKPLRNQLREIHPVTNGVITDMDRMEKLWHYAFNQELRMYPDESPVILTEVAWNHKEVREKTATCMFETFNVPSLYLADQSVMALNAVGKTNGIVLHSGATLTRTVPIYEGYSLKHAILKLKAGGDDIVRNLQQRMKEKYSVGDQELYGHYYAFRDLAECIKEKDCYISIDPRNEKISETTYDFEMVNFLKISETNYREDYELPDGAILKLSSEKYECSEFLFDRDCLKSMQLDNKYYKYKFDGVEYGIHEMIYQSIKKCEEGVQKEMFNNIVLDGGNTMLRGMEERIIKEMQHFGGNNKILVGGYIRENYMKYNRLGQDVYSLIYKYTPSRCRIIPSNKKYGVWIGAAILSSMSRFNEMLICKTDYDESGPSIVHRKCF